MKVVQAILALPISMGIVSLFPIDAQAGTATYYHPSLTGRRMANGKPYNPNAMTAASNAYPLGAWVRVTNNRTKKSVIVKITDRCGNCSIDLSKAAFSRIAHPKKGRVAVSIQRIKR